MSGCKLFAGCKTSKLALEICRFLEIETGRVQISRFSNGELYVCYLEDVRDTKILLMPDFVNKDKDVMEFFQMIDAAHQNEAHSIIVVLPFCPYARQNRKILIGEGIPSLLFSKLLKVAGADQLVTIDLHSPEQCQNFEIPTVNVNLEKFWLKYLQEKIDDKANCLILAADKGMKPRVEYLSSRLNCCYGYADKQRGCTGEVEIKNIYGDVYGKNVYLVDDLIDTGHTLASVTKQLKHLGALKITGIVTHGVTRKSALDVLSRCKLDALVSTNTLPVLMSREFPTEVVSVVPLLGKHIKRFL